MPTTPLSHVEQQIKAARADLDKYQPDGADWLKKSLVVSRSLVPWLCDHAPAMKEYVEGVLNAPVKLRVLWQEIRGKVNLPAAKIAEFDRQLTLDDVMRESITGEVVSKVITRYLKVTHGGLAENSRSDYPDIFMTDLDYGFLPKFARGANQNYGAALKKDKPVRVPDGLEIKTCRNRVAVDCHLSPCWLASRFAVHRKGSVVCGQRPVGGVSAIMRLPPVQREYGRHDKEVFLQQ